MPTADGYERMANKLVALQKKRQPRPTPKPVASEPNPLEGMVNNYVRTAPAVAQSQAENNFFNPVSSVHQAVNQGRLPTRGEVGLDGALLAAGAIPFGKIGTTAARLGGGVGRRVAPKGGPTAVSQFLGAPKTGYHGTLNRDVLNQTLNSGEQVIPRGMELIRMPSAGQVTRSQYSQSVPLPREIGADYLAGRPNLLVSRLICKRWVQLCAVWLRILGERFGGTQV